MKVSGRNPSAVQQSNQSPVSAKDKSDVASTKSKPNIAEMNDASKVSVSSKAQQMNQAKEIIKKQPDVDEAKVAKFQELIDGGKYKVDAKAVADKLVDEHLMFPS